MPTRLHSLDQFRGYTVAGMFLVNFVGRFQVTHHLLQHHNTYCSYADTIMPQFFFAVGMALRLAFLRHAEKSGFATAYKHAIWRGLGLLLVGAVVYHLDGNYRSWADLQAADLLGTFWRRNLFQALVHIAVTSLWVLPVIARSARTQLLFLLGSALAHVLISQAGWHSWLRANRVIDGGALGFLTYTIPVIAGSLTYMWLQQKGRDYRRFLLVSTLLMLAGYGLSCLTNGGVWAAPPFVEPWHARDMWTMSQQAGSVSYLTFSTGFSLLLYTGFLWLTDEKGRQLATFRTLGANALAGYILHSLVADAVKPFAPADSPFWWATASFALYFAITWLFLRSMEKSNLYLRL